MAASKDEQTFYRLGDKLPDVTQIIKAREDSILLRAADGSACDMYVLHETKAVASLPYSPSPRKCEYRQKNGRLPPMKDGITDDSAIELPTMSKRSNIQESHIRWKYRSCKT